MKNVKELNSYELQNVSGGGAWSNLGQVVGGMVTGASGMGGLGTVLCGPPCGIVGGLYGAVAGGAAAGWDASRR